MELKISAKDGHMYSIRPSRWRVCLVCNTVVTEVNHSGWNGFTETKGLTLPVCTDCIADFPFNMPEKKPRDAGLATLESG